tara:strand:- start:3191 stop:3868 length:678 start_codon:yes stop_codon:yes gene_type:complete
MSIICTICARSNSHGLKNKNFLKIKGKTLIRRTIDQAVKSNLFEIIAVSVDKKKIDLGKNLKKIMYIKRPKNLAGSNSKKIDAIRHAVKICENKKKKIFEYVCDLDVSSPLRNHEDIKNSLNKFKREKSLNLITATESKKNPYFNQIEIKNKKVKIVKKKNRIYNRQQAPVTYDMNASIYLWKRDFLFKSYNLFNKKTSVYFMPQDRSVDIDSNFDFKFVKFLLE